MEVLRNPTRNLFFTGKGGVGKTSLACAVAISLADSGKRVLLVSTDPASNLDEVLGTQLGQKPTAVPSVPRLFALNINPEAAARDYRERMVEPYRGILPDAALTSMEEQLSGSCTVEIAAFDEFAKLLGDRQATQEFDHVIFDTAPTGHTLRLLTLPSAWSGFLADNTTGTSCLGPLAGLQAQQQLYQHTVQSLSDPAITTLVLVARADIAAFTEAARTSGELATLGVHNQHLIINGVFRTTDLNDPVAQSMQRRADQALAQIPAALASLPRTTVPLAPFGLLGADALRAIAAGRLEEAVWSDIAINTLDELHLGTLPGLIEELALAGRGVVMTMGKGGVGKTTVAAAVAVALADRGFPVHLSTTDPAAHLAAAVHGNLTNLQVSKIDPRAEIAAYTAEVMATAGANLDEHGRALLEEDLRSPCTEEIAVFRAFAAAVDRGRDGFVVLDTAPTGHTILLLDAALAYHREISRQASQLPASVQELLPRLRDPSYTRVLVVTLPEATPVHEAAQLQRDLRRAGIEPFGWVINQSLSTLEVNDPVLLSRKRHEAIFLCEVAKQHASRVALIPWQVEPPVGIEALRRLGVSSEELALQE
ncbi:MAG: arsenical pump-driving ATPase [Planctomycetales bacterium]|nr:arsenical pump-driving ATPase [Planctomycetales bacterium]